jgi:hypothetical protein
MITSKCRFVSVICFVVLIIGDPITSLYITPPLSTQLYVVPFPSLMGDEGDGSLTYPYSSLQQALDHIENEYYRDINSASRTTINLYPTHHFVDTLRLRQAHSHTRLTTMNAEDTAIYEELAAREHTHQRLSTASISGGIPVTGWTQVSGNTYSAPISQLIFVNQLFVNNQRVVRTRVPTNYSDYLQYVAPLKDPNKVRNGFQYAPGQFDYKSLADAMVVVYHSWTESHHYIDQIITANNTILFTNPSDHPIGADEPQANRRFHIENVCEALVPNSFCFVKNKNYFFDDRWLL